MTKLEVLSATGIDADETTVPKEAGGVYDVAIRLSRAVTPSEQKAIKAAWGDKTVLFGPHAGSIRVRMDGDLLWVTNTTVEAVAEEYVPSVREALAAAQRLTVNEQLAKDAEARREEQHRAHVSRVGSRITW